MVGRLKSLEDGAAPLVTFLQNPNAVQELRADKQYNLQMLNDRYQVELPPNCIFVIFFTFRRLSNILTFIGTPQGELDRSVC